MIILIMQRLHVDDLVGHVLEQADDWTHLNLPAVAPEDQVIDLGRGIVHRRARGDLLHPEREPQAELDKMQRQMGSQLFSAQYNQAPVPRGGNLIQRSWFRTYDRPPDRCTGDQIIQSWDTASQVSPTNDFSVGTTWLMRRHEYYLLDVFRDRLGFPDLRRRVVAYAERYAATAVLIENAGSGMQLIQQLRSEGPIQPIKIDVDRDKVARLEGVSAVIEAGHVILPQEAPWLAEFLNEVLAFPSGHHDDQADSLSQFLAWALRRHRLSSGVGGRPELFEA